MTYIRVTGLTFGNALQFNQDFNKGGSWVWSMFCLLGKLLCYVCKGLLPRIIWKVLILKFVKWKKQMRCRSLFFVEAEFWNVIWVDSNTPCQIPSANIQPSLSNLAHIVSPTGVSFDGHPTPPPPLLPWGNPVRGASGSSLQTASCYRFGGQIFKATSDYFSFINSVLLKRTFHFLSPFFFQGSHFPLLVTPLNRYFLFDLDNSL